MLKYLKSKYKKKKTLIDSLVIAY